MTRLPLLPTLIVGVAVAVMIGLGIWQLQRAEWKEGMIASLEAARKLPPVSLNENRSAGLEFRSAEARCAIPESQAEVRGGRSRTGQPGFVHLARCLADGRPLVTVDAGWSADPQSVVRIEGRGPFTGVLRKAGSWEGIDPHLYVLVLDRPLAGLRASAQPSPGAVPNNHRLYAVQWFFFAGAALLIYILALRRRRHQRP